ncbi:AraC family transcriptional regulator [Saccharopolyspora sp. NFXS83]|uniref:helix-turn-helix domain-containing protein n=1 Tax=Saccharopolyspora sp. NFXS83 TaxID=2993560 RepID=UPI00224B182C|nr:AraC family transcriptional regulator [Saccharopolyspora sp. NFXS83]MCX2729514.1 AraC family transcriptional regulator [Saccharopolyspora sp. NFXS83]
MHFVNALPVAGHVPAGVESARHRPGGQARRGWDCAGYEERLPAPVPLRVLPSSRVTLTLGFGDPITLTRDGSADEYRSVVLGLRDGAEELTIGGRQRGLVLRCDPLLGHAVLGVPLHLLTGAAPCLAAVLGAEAVRLADAPDWDVRFAVLADTIAALLARGPRADPEVAWAWRRLRACAGDVRVEALAARLGWSRRPLVRRFHHQLGITPKAAARVLRFERAAELLARGSRGLARVAADAGYADQAHLSREVRALTRWTPTQLRRSASAAAGVPFVRAGARRAQ